MKALTKNIYLINSGKANVYIIKGAAGLTLVDTGVAGVKLGLERQLNQMGYTLADIIHILITHAHVDHVGGLAELQAATTASTWVHRLDTPIVRGEQAVPRPDPKTLSRQDRLMGGVISSFVGAVQQAARVDRVLEHAECLDEVHEGLEVIHLPGHSPGQIGFWLKQEGVLIGGDVVMHITPWLTRPMGAYTPNMPEAERSILTVDALAVKTLGVGHGQPLVGNAAPEIAKLASKLRRLRKENDDPVRLVYL